MEQKSKLINKEIADLTTKQSQAIDTSKFEEAQILEDNLAPLPLCVLAARYLSKESHFL